MLHYDRIDLSEEINRTKSKNNIECIVCHYWYFNHGFKFQNSVCNGCHDLTMFCLNLSDIAIITVKGVDCCCIVHDISKSGAIFLLENSAFDDRVYKMHIKETDIKNIVYNCYFDNLIKAKKLETKNVLINEKKI